MLEMAVMTRETTNQADIRDHFCALGWRLWRCNTGVLLDRNGTPVRFGLANDSKEMNAALKPGDLIGWRPRLITPDMVGDVVAQFVSVEAKKSGWTFPRPTNKAEFAHCSAQKRWADMINREGGLAGFMIDPAKGFEPA